MSDHVFNVGDDVVIRHWGRTTDSYQPTKIARETSTRWYTTEGAWFSKTNLRGQRPVGPYSAPEMLPASDPGALRSLGLRRLGSATYRLDQLVRNSRPYAIDLEAVRNAVDAVTASLQNLELVVEQ